MNCSACSRANDPRRGFCGGCGAPLGRTCTRCGFRNDAADRFCGGCGQGIGTEPRAPDVPGLAPAARAEDRVLSAQDVTELLRKTMHGATAAPPPLPARVTQDDVDKLFGEAI